MPCHETIWGCKISSHLYRLWFREEIVADTPPTPPPPNQGEQIVGLTMLKHEFSCRRRHSWNHNMLTGLRWYSGASSKDEHLVVQGKASFN